MLAKQGRMARNGKGHISLSRRGFLFVGNHLALDFVNTRPLQNGQFTELLSDFDTLLRWFQAADLLSSGEARDVRKHWGRSPGARHTLDAIRDFREVLRTDVIAIEGGQAVRRSTIEQLNRLLAEHPMLTRLKSGDSYATESWFRHSQPEDLFAPLAYGAAMLFANVDRTRVRKCGQCVLHFFDTSKKGTRRWCSMNLCGNRFKVAAYAARRSAQHK